MKTRLSTIAAALAALVLSLLVVTPQSAQAATGLYVADGRLYDANGVEFVMRGVSHAHTWYASRTGAFADIKSLGANTVRVVLSSGDRWTRNDAADVASVVSLCRQNRLICVLEVHDTTGYGEQSGAVSLDRAVDYWLSIASALAGQEPYVIVNIGNEPYGNQNYASWAADTSGAIQRLRNAGFDHTIMVDAPNWGQDWSFTMRDNAASVFAGDPDRNTLFAIHMYGVFDTAAEITDYLGRFRAAGLPIVVGEFGHNHSDGDPDEATIMSYSQANGIGYLGWSWSGNGGGVEYLDMVTDFDVTRLTSWGQRIFNGVDGIRQTAREATVFGGPTPTLSPTNSPTASPTVSPTAGPTTPPPGPVGCVATYSVGNQWPGGFQAEVRVTAGGTSISGWTVSWTYADGQTISQVWNATLSGAGPSVTARNLAYNGGLAAGASTTFGFLGAWQGANSVPVLRCVAS
ncbi:cellulase family glycosylhydrolase [Micromonospora sp. NPDC003197]